ncbi:Uncharacterised protein [Clostridium tetani]|uniref:DUF3888 domain-containing protein n=1 Tax=Clostridium tetani TaxID=1513 RepID=UPI000E11A4C6|nr:DUF3888 domain-containing protein [Clostridium tetani]WFN62437.1 DUF3888 domain-containing protein [Clostridium tetani]SUY54623.1 Uncharacterised protein [Clostridium tetani]BDR71718.1 hypothetical protein K144316041_04260 [Clostridium tetani]BDR77495.1 hypothetical protein K154307017_04280 [Clostridium tetani]BDR77498.1 hypothetical protein K154307017_04310 [Clostridium tetani]
MKKVLVDTLLVLLLTLTISSNVIAFSKTNNMKFMLTTPYNVPKHSQEELYQDILYSMLTPYIQKSVDDYYTKFLSIKPIVDPMSIDILSVERPNGYRTFYFVIKMKVMPYVGSHNTVGIDHITITVDGIDELKVNDFEHIEDCPC